MTQRAIDIQGSTSEREARANLLREIREGLTQTPKSTPSKYFYDKRGSDLFDEITELEEYYPTRAETQILTDDADSLLNGFAPSDLIEIGAGMSRKTQILIDHLRPKGLRRFLATDVSEDALRDAGRRLSRSYPGLEFQGVIADFSRPFPDIERRGERLVAFLGSTFGNFKVAERAPFLRRIRSLLAEGDGFLMGVDLIKERGILEAAYNDTEGLTAEFNLNLLRVLNRDLNADFPVEAFEHRAIYNAEDQRIEMWLVASRDLRVRVEDLDLEVDFRKGEAMRTEVSCKFTRAIIQDCFQEAGLDLFRWIPDRFGHFAVAIGIRAAP